MKSGETPTATSKEASASGKLGASSAQSVNMDVENVPDRSEILKRKIQRSLSIDYGRYEDQNNFSTKATAAVSASQSGEFSATNVSSNGDESEDNMSTEVRKWICKYFGKWRGAGEGLFPPMPTTEIVVWSFISCFIGVSLVSFIMALLTPQIPFTSIESEIGQKLFFLIISVYASSAVFVFGVIDSPEAQPRNLVLGNLISFAIGSAVAEIFNFFGYGSTKSAALIWLELALAISLSLCAMQVTRTLHAPGGSAAALVVLLQPSFRDNGLLFVFSAMLGVLVLLFLSLLINNITRQYPRYWWKPRIVAHVITEKLGEEGEFQVFGEAFRAGKLTFKLPKDNVGLEDFIADNLPVS